MVGVWTIEIDSSPVNYKEINFERKLDTKIPSKFDAQIEFSSGINYWDLVEIKRDGTTEWKGFIEDKDEKWDKDGRFLYIGGRDTSLILWKKWSDNFIEMHEATEGFFGLVSAIELIKFLLRCPKSDPFTTYPNNKEGWGIDKGRISDCSAHRTSLGDPNWVKLRRRGYGWRNTGSPYNSINANVDAVISNVWSTNGASPYLNTEDDLNYIYSKIPWQEAIFGFENLSTLDATATNVERCFINVVWKPETSWWMAARSKTSMYVSVDGGTIWYIVGSFGGKDSIFGPNPWRTYSFDISNIVDSVTDADAVRVKFVCMSDMLYTYITHAYLSFSYVTNGEQAVKDWFDIPFEEDTIVGCYIESRIDNDSYPRNYAIYSVVKSEQVYTGYTEVDPTTTHITKSASKIDFDAYMNEDAYVYKDFTAGYFSSFMRHWVKFTPITDPIPEPAAGGEVEGNILCFWALSNALNDLYGLYGNNDAFLALTVWRDPDDIINGGAPCFNLIEYDGSTYQSTNSAELTEGSIYTFEIVRGGDNLVVTIYEDDIYWATLTLTLNAGSATFRYLFGCLTSNTATASYCECDVENLGIEVETQLVAVNSNTYRDILHSWTPTTMSNLRIRITSATANKSWAISQVYIYKADDLDYRVWKEIGSPTFPDEQYIQAVSADSAYTTPLGPLNVSRGRLLDVINDIVAKCHASYVPFECWLAMDATNTVHIKNQRGSDVSGSVSFVKGTNLGEVENNGSVADTAQRIQVVGKSEGKRQEKINSSWAEDTGEMANVNTFYEDILTEKTLANKELADLVANIALTDSAPPKEPKNILVTRDTYASMAYDVGDDATFTDSLTSLSGAHRIYNIRKTINDNGESIVITIDSARRVPDTEIKEIYRKLKELGVVGVITSDWTGEGTKEDKIDAKVVTESFSKTAKNGEESDKDITDPSWYISLVPLSYTPYGNHKDGTAVQSYTFSNGMAWKHKSEWMGLWGPNTGSGTDWFYVERRGESYIDELNVRMDQNPKFEAEIRAIRDTTGNINGVNPCNWNVGDYVLIGMYDKVTERGFVFKLIKESAGNTLKVYALWNIAGTSTEILIREIDISDHENDDIRYKLEILTDVQDDDHKFVIFNIYDLNIEGQKYPPSSIVANIDNTLNVKPFFACISADRDGSVDNLCIFYIYSYKVEWEKLNPYYSET